MNHRGSASTGQSKPRRIVFEDEMDSVRPSRKSPEEAGSGQQNPAGSLDTPHPSGHTPRARVVADYILKYPVLLRVEDRDRYKAVFNDQYQEYKDLHAEVSSTLARFTQMDNMMDKLLRDDNSKGDKMRIDQIWQNYKQKKNNPAFLEKKERCEYLKAKLSHIKNRIRDYDQNTVSGGQS